MPKFSVIIAFENPADDWDKELHFGYEGGSLTNAVEEYNKAALRLSISSDLYAEYPNATLTIYRNGKPYIQSHHYRAGVEVEDARSRGACGIRFQFKGLHFKESEIRYE